jgi:hypothetical protein
MRLDREGFGDCLEGRLTPARFRRAEYDHGSAHFDGKIAIAFSDLLRMKFFGRYRVLAFRLSNA